MSLDTILKLLPIVTLIAGGIVFSLNRYEKRQQEKAEAIKKAKEIEMKLLNIEANYERVAEELEDVRKDFAQFVQQWLFNKSK